MVDDERPKLHEELWEQLGRLDAGKTARKSMCQYLADCGQYVVVLLNRDYTVDPGQKNILNAQGETAGFIEQLCILAYLINASDTPQAGKLVQPESLPGGDFFFRGIHTVSTDKLERCFGYCPGLLYEIVDRFDAQRCGYGDASIKLYVLARLPVTFVIWKCDDEFPPRASVLFDKNAHKQLPLDALLAAANFAIDSLIKAVQ